MKIIVANSKKYGAKEIFVDDEDYDYLMQWKWSVMKKRNTFYAYRCPFVNGKQTTIRMHMVIMKTPKGMDTDHIDHNGINNQRNNLRVVTHQQNIWNSLKRKDCISCKYKGVVLNNLKANGKIYSRWMAKISINGKSKTIGRFKTAENAAIAYNIFAEKYYGEFAILNTPNT